MVIFFIEFFPKAKLLLSKGLSILIINRGGARDSAIIPIIIE